MNNLGHSPFYIFTKVLLGQIFRCEISGYMCKRKNSWTIVKVVKTDYLQELLEWGKDLIVELVSILSITWTSVDLQLKEQNGKWTSGWKITKRKRLGKRGSGLGLVLGVVGKVSSLPGYREIYLCFFNKEFAFLSFFIVVKYI